MKMTMKMNGMRMTMKFKVVAQRTFTIDYEVEVEADNEAEARLMVEQCNEDIPEWEDSDDCCVEHWHNFDEETPNVFEIREVA